MRHLSRPALLALLLVLVLLPCGLPAAGQTASLVKDIFPGFNSRQDGGARLLGAIKDKILYTSLKRGAGEELWGYDGTGAGPRLLADFCPGECSSSLQSLGTARSLFFGIATHGDLSRSALWRTDGTRQGTFMLPDPTFRVDVEFDNASSSYKAVMTRNLVYFTGCTEEEGCDLWRSDGTVAGTFPLTHLAAHGFGDDPSELTLVGNRIFFIVRSQLWVSDGTSAGTVMVREFSEWPRRLAALGSRVLFLAPDSGEELWITDGTAAGTHPLTSFAPAAPFQQTRFLKVLDSRAYFVADDTLHGAELWASDGTPQGTVRITEFGFHSPFIGAENENYEGLQPWSLTKVGNRVLFWASDGLSGFNVWSTLGTPQSTAPSCASCRFSGDLNPRFLFRDGMVLFRALDEEHGTEIWTTDGTQQGTRLVRDLCRGDCFGASTDPVEVAGKIFFMGSNGRSDYRLWTTDGSPEGTRLFAAVEADVHAEGSLATLDGEVFFFGGEGEGEFSEELWASDGTPAGTIPVTATPLSGHSFGITQTTSLGGRVYFTACDGDALKIWRSEGSAETTQAFQEPSIFCHEEEDIHLTLAGGKMFLITQDRNEQVWRLEEDGRSTRLAEFERFAEIRSFSPFKNQLYFAVAQDNLVSIWRSDGTPQGTAEAFDWPDSLFPPRFMTAAGAGLWFATEKKEEFDTGIWVTDGTSGGAREVLDLFTSWDEDPEFLAIGSRVYFLAPKPSSGNVQVWRSDGTASGTEQVTDSAFRPAELTELQGSLYFFANLPEEEGRGLWRSDGTAAGTVLLKAFPVAVERFGRIPRFGLTTLGPWLIFVVEDGVHGRELWRSDGTAAGTVLVRDIFPGPGSSDASGFTAAAGSLFFSANDGAHGFELWRTDGTPAGTRLVQDISPEGASSRPEAMAEAGGRLFFGADDSLFGHELWSLPLSGPPCQPSDKILCLNGGRFKVEAAWRTSESSGPGYARALTPDTGYFFFFDDDNVEVVAKVLDGQGINGHFWVYYGALSNVEYHLTVTDTQTGLARRYFNPQERFASVGDSQAFGPRGAYELKSIAPASPAPDISERLDLAKATGACVPAATRLCLNQGRFAVEVAWEDFAGERGVGKAVGLTNDTGYFWFFNDANVETIIKVLDATAVNGKFWVYYGALSDVKYDITVTDTLTGKQKVYKNPKGRFASAGDISAF
jgi:ELWxxDGT repeat protein